MVALADLVVVVVWLRTIVFIGLGVSAGRRSGPRDPTLPDPSRRITVVVPAHDEARHIAETLRCLLDQDHRPCQIVVVDDGSIDDTARIAEDVLRGVAHATVVRLPVNGGKAAALNAGVRLATGDLVATIDADTRLATDALAESLATMTREGADAVAFYVDVDNRRGFLGSLQRHEYIASLNFERAGQGVIGAIAVLPGAATLFRSDALRRHPFSARSLTEDCDLTLTLAGRGLRCVVAASATARTAVPDRWRNLLAQRTRWNAGHLACCGLHVRGVAGRATRFRLVTLPNFVLATASAPASLLAVGAIVVEGRAELLGLPWGSVVALSSALALLQRACAWTADKGRPEIRMLLVEPIVTGFVGAFCFVAAVWRLTRHRARW